jgi:hypothetical protein
MKTEPMEFPPLAPLPFFGKGSIEQLDSEVNKAALKMEKEQRH